MLLLLDTHILIPLIEGERSRIPTFILKELEKEQNSLMASVASLWEIAIKTRLGKLTMAIRVAHIPSELTGMEIDVLTIDERHVLAELDPDPPTGDPFDRLLLAQCQVENMKLVTIDRALANHPLAWSAG